MKYSSLCAEALKSYVIFLKHAAFMLDSAPKAVLLKWPDVANAAINLLDNPTEELYKNLEDDLKTLIFEPVNIIYQSVCDRVCQVLEKPPIGIKNKVMSALAKKDIDIVGARDELVSCINELLDILRTMTGSEYQKV